MLIKYAYSFSGFGDVGKSMKSRLKIPILNAWRTGMRLHYRDAFFLSSYHLSALCGFVSIWFLSLLPDTTPPFPIFYLSSSSSLNSPPPPYLGDQTKPLSRFPLPSPPSPLYPSWPADSGEEFDNLSIGLGCSIGILASLGNSLSLKDSRSEFLTPSGSVFS